MNVISLEFLIFSGVTLIAYYLLPVRFQNLLLVVASFIFLASWALPFAGIVALLILVNYSLALRIRGKDHTSRLVLWSGIVLNILALLYFRYNHFFVDEFEAAINASGIPLNTESLRFILPIGLSYFALQNVSYFLDIWNGVVQPTDELVQYAVYMAYFPKFVAGPIERVREFIPQLVEKRTLTNDNFSNAFVLLAQGAFRKIVLADVLLTIIPNDVFSQPRNYSSAALMVWLLAYAFALYNDFAGYTKFVRGISLFFGIELTRNFATPYFARNFGEFWQRWHISLSNWLRDYIFSPMSRALLRRKYKARHIYSIVGPPMATMIVSALWHEIAPAMMLWGVLHGIYLIVERLRAIYLKPKPAQQQAVWRQISGGISVSLLAMVAWVPFRADLSASFDYWLQLLSFDLALDWSFHLHIIVIIVVILTLFLDVIEYWKGEFAYRWWPTSLQAFLLSVAIILATLVLLARSEAPPPFIYQGF